MSGIAEQQYFSVHVPGRGFYRDHRAGGIACVIFLELRHERNGVGKSLLEKVLRFFSGVEGREAFAAFERQKQDAREGAVSIGQRDEHIGAARPDVQRVWFQNMFSARASRDGQFLITVIELFLCEIQGAAFLHIETQGGSRAVRADYDFGVYRGFAAGLFVAKTGAAGAPVHSGAAFVEMNRDALSFGGVHQRDVEVGARN